MKRIKSILLALLMLSTLFITPALAYDVLPHLIYQLKMAFLVQILHSLYRLLLTTISLCVKEIPRSVLKISPLPLIP